MLKYSIATFLLYLSVYPVNADPYIPPKESTVLTTLRAPDDPLNQELKNLAINQKKSPENLELAVKLSESYLQASRITGDPRYAGYAEKTLEPWLSRKSPPEVTRVISANLKQFRHDFKGAIKDLDQIIRNNPRNVQARITRSNIYRVQGKYNAAIKDCLSLALISDPLAVAICQTSITSLNGKIQWSYDNLEKLLNRRGKAAPVNLKTWAHITLAEMSVRMGEMQQAEQHFQMAKTNSKTPDIYLRSAHIDLLLEQNKAREVYDLIKEKNLSDPILLRKALAAKKLNNSEHAALSQIIKSRFMDSTARGDSGHLREEARFELHLNNKPERALELAIENWKVQREPWDTRLVLEAALAAKKYNKANPVITWVKKTKLEDTKIQKLVMQITEAAK